MNQVILFWTLAALSQIVVQFPLELLVKLATVIVILIATWIVSKILGTFVFKAVGKLNQNVARSAKRIVSWLIWLFGILIVLDQLGLELSILLVIIALGGIIATIALRDILSNVASHEVITTYSPFKIGDWIQVDKYFGRVVDITWMDTVLITLDNEIVHVPNSKITGNIVVNRTAPGGIRISIPFTIDKVLDLSDVEKVLLEIGTELGKELVPDSSPEVRVTSIGNRSIKLALLLRINNPAKGRLIASEVRERAKERIDKIEKRTPA